ncbi:MAG: hypothetical protein EBU88_16645 [Acidobacteria bacterium]|nr:hypothetical protein [Acidobacteriota bacterium]
MDLQTRKPWTRVDQGIDSVKITMQIVRLAACYSFDRSTTRRLMLGGPKEIGTRLATVKSWKMPDKV